MNMTFHYNVIIDFVSLMLLIVLMYGKHKNPARDLGDKVFNQMIVALLFVFLLDIPAWALDGATFNGIEVVLWILNTGYYAFQAVFCYLWFTYVIYYISKSRTKVKRITIPALIPLIVELVFSIINIWTGSIFFINSNSEYVRGPLYFVNLIPYIIYIISSVIITIYSIIRASNSIEKRRIFLLLAFMLLPISALVLDSIYYGLALMWPCTALLILMVYVTNQNQVLLDEQLQTLKESQKASQLKSELTDSKVLLMLSQIQPHFIFNSLAVIQELCHTNPPLAEQATGNFSKFLRANIDSISTTKLIPFTQELEHTENYISLEKLRFQQRLHVIYDIKATDFNVPTLTLQPIVENSVRYGLMKREDGGTVLIATREQEKEFIIHISDNGIGFDKESIHKLDDSHAGIKNVTERVTGLCNGHIDIDSIPGEGTTVEIHIPKER